MQQDDTYFENGLMVFTERFHLRRGQCCGSGCRHCPFDHDRVPQARRATLPKPRPYFPEKLPGGSVTGDVERPSPS